MRKIKLFTKKSCWQQDISKREYALAAVRGAALILVICLLFYHSLLVGLVVLVPLDILYLSYWQKQFELKKQNEFAIQFLDAIESLTVALRTGYSMENAMRETLRDMLVMYKEDVRVIRELTQMNRQIQMNIPAEQVWQELSDRIEQEDVQNFTEVFVIARRSGGDVISILRNTAKQIRDKSDVKREIDTIMSQKQLEFKVMSAVPLGIIAYMTLSFADFMEALYGNTAGVCIMSICLGLYGAAYWLGKKIIKIEV
ncbi:MAG: type II secretion system F family protein [Lachnospiraceae bacterium]